MNAAAQETANAYFRLFSTDDGRRVLADLRSKFPPDAPRFPARDSGPHDPLAAAVIDGRCHVVREILKAIDVGNPTNPTR